MIQKFGYISFLLIAIVGVFLIQTDTVYATSDPSTDKRCWTREECVGPGTAETVSVTVKGIWDNQSDEAKDQCPGYGYCYPPRTDVKLAVSLPIKEGVITSVAGLGSYIDTIYKFMLGISTTIVIVMIMVGGLQYVLASGSSGELGKAKKRITDALTGLLLLLFAWLILFTVNPELIHLEMPKLPRIKPAFFYSKETSCEWFMFQGYEIDTPQKECGAQDGELKKYKGLDVSSQNITCKWSSCSTFENTYKPPGIVAGGELGLIKKTCMNVRGESKCVSCMDIVKNNSFSVIPSSESCITLGPADKYEIFPDNSTGKLLNDFECFFTKDPAMTNETAQASQGVCALVNINCEEIRALKEGKRCQGYDIQRVANNNNNKQLDTIQLGKNHGLRINRLLAILFLYYNYGDYTLGSACLSDPCGVGPCVIEGSVEYSWDITSIVTALDSMIGYDCIHPPQP